MVHLFPKRFGEMRHVDIAKKKRPKMISSGHESYIFLNHNQKYFVLGCMASKMEPIQDDIRDEQCNT